MATPSKWNERPEPILQANQRSASARAEHINWAVSHGVVMVAALVVTANSSMLDNIVGAWSGAAGSWAWLLLWLLHYGLAVFGYITAIACGLLLVQQVAAMFGSQKKLSWEKDATARQKQLLGLIRGPLPPPPATLTPAPKSRTATTPIGPPLRNVKPLASPATPKAAIVVDTTQGRVPGSSDRSMGSANRIVSTPEQAQQYLEMFETDLAPRGSPDAGFRGFGAVSPPYLPGGGSRISPVAMAGSTMSVPTYRPSLVATGSRGSPLRSADGRMAPSTSDAVAAAMERVHIPNRATVDAGIERLREWLASQVVQPLVQSLATAHKDLENTLGQLGWGSVRIAPLAAPDNGGEVRRAGGPDEEGVVGQLLGHLEASVPPRAAPTAQTPALQTCLEAAKRYLRLAALTKGEHPRALLPPTPRGYVVSRLQSLAEGPCLSNYKWNGGGSWAGKPWSSELPPDSALLFFIFAAFLEMPSWQLPLEEATSSPAAHCPLYLGTIPTRPAESYAALLATRPAANLQGAVAILGLGMGTPEPHFTLVINGETAVTLGTYNALFQVIYMFLQYVKHEMGASISGRSLSYLHLDAVLKPVEQERKFRWSKLFSMKALS